MRRLLSIMVVGSLLLAACGGTPAETPVPPVSDPGTALDAPPAGENADSASSEEAEVPVETEPVAPDQSDAELDALRAIAEDPCSLTPAAVLDEHRDITVAGDLISESGTDPDSGIVTGICSYWEQYRLTIVVPGPDYYVEDAFRARLPENNTELNDYPVTAFWGFDTLTLYVLHDGYWITIENLDTTDESPLVAVRALYTIAERRLPSP